MKILLTLQQMVHIFTARF